MKTILVPTDFSDYALNAMRVASVMARKLKARIWLVHSSDIPTIGVKEFAYYENFYKNIKDKAESELDRLISLDFLKGLKINKFLVTDRPVWQIFNLKKFSRADLVVIGSHGRSGFNRVLLGSNTEKIIRMADAPVLTIKRDRPGFNIAKLVLASDFKEQTNPVFEKIKFLVRAYKPQIFLLKVITPSDFEATPESFRLMKEFKDQYALKKCSINIYNSSSIESGIADFSQEVGADLIAIPTHGRTGLSHLINGSMAESIAAREPKPVLSIKIPKEEEPELEIPPEASIYQNLEFF